MHTFRINNQLVHSSWTQGGSNSFGYCLTCVNVAYDLWFTLGGVSALF